MGFYTGSTMGVIKGNTRSLDYDLFKLGFGGFRCITAVLRPQC